MKIISRKELKEKLLQWQEGVVGPGLESLKVRDGHPLCPLLDFTLAAKEVPFRELSCLEVLKVDCYKFNSSRHDPIIFRN